VLRRLLETIQHQTEPVTLTELGKRLEIEASALAPMIELLARRGLIDRWCGDLTAIGCDAGAGGSRCGGPSGCPLLGTGEAGPERRRPGDPG